MQLRSFSVQGFKNFRQKITLDDLGPVNVIHGPNNVGKSNLLQAVRLFFFLCGLPTTLPDRSQVQNAVLNEHGFEAIFNLEMPMAITLDAELSMDVQDYARSGQTPVHLQTGTIKIGFELTRTGLDCTYRISRLQLGDGKDLVNKKHGVDVSVNGFVSIGLFHTIAFMSKERVDRFGLAGVERQYDGDIALALYDAKESRELEQSRRWERFVEGMSSFEDVLGKGKFVAIYQRKLEKAMLVFETDRARILLQLLGSGVQKIAALLGMLAAGDATIIGIEEPELNLRYSLQLRLRDVLQTMIGGPGGLDQIFITSHSDAFETGSHFYYMVPSPDGPRVEKRDVKFVRESLDITQSTELSHRNAPLCYVSTEGVGMAGDKDLIEPAKTTDHGLKDVS